MVQGRVAILAGHGVTKYFGGLAAVNKVDFEILPGEIFALIGPNGAGKTTLFNLVAGALRPTGGHLYFKGKEITGSRPHENVKRGIARTFQIVKPLRELRVLDNIRVGAHFGRRRADKDPDAVAEEVLHLMKLAPFRDALAGSLPIGFLKRLEVARALATNPEVLLLDEVAAGLTPAETEEMIGLIRRVRDELGITIFYIEHDMRAVMQVADRIMVLNYGEKIAEGTPEEIATNPRVIQAYLGTSMERIQRWLSHAQD